MPLAHKSHKRRCGRPASHEARTRNVTPANSATCRTPEASLATRSTDGEALETERLKTKLGEMLLGRELLEAKIAALEANRPLARRRSRR